MTKTIDTLLKDIENILEKNHVPSEENLAELGRHIVASVKDKMKRDGGGKFNIRFSNMGYPDRYLWYSSRAKVTSGDLDYSTVLKFLIGDIYEAVLLFLMKEAGHEIIDHQKPVNLDGMTGRMDGKVDGVPFDIKSASSNAFRQKFIENKLVQDDHFGYLAQISGYAQGDPDHDDTKGVVIIGADKESGKLAMVHLDPLELIDARQRAAEARRIVESPERPERCYPDVDDGKSGNRKIAKNCQWCAFKFPCWSDANDGEGLRVFRYSSGPTYLTKVVNLPKVEEITPKKDNEDGLRPDTDTVREST